MRIVIVVIALALGGCSANFAANWTRPGASPAQAESDWRRCEYESNFARAIPGVQNECMRLLGYRHAISG